MAQLKVLRQIRRFREHGGLGFFPTLAHVLLAVFAFGLTSASSAAEPYPADGYAWTCFTNFGGGGQASGNSPADACGKAVAAIGFGFQGMCTPNGQMGVMATMPGGGATDCYSVIAWHQGSGCLAGYDLQPDGSCKPPTPLPPVQACAVGHPVIPGTGTKILLETDSGGSIDLPVTRSYRSNSVFASNGGAGQWVFNWQRQLDTKFLTYVAPQISALRSDGSMLIFLKTGANWVASGTQDTLQAMTDANGKVTGWRYGVTNTGAVETYDANGKLLSIRERNGRTTSLTYNSTAQLTQVTAPSSRSLTFAYDAQGRVSSVTAPDNAITQYGYNANGMLTTVTWPDNTTRQYVYEDSQFPTALTGVIDEAGVRYATYAYDDQGRAITSELTAGADRYQFQYQANGQTIVTQPSGTTSTYTFLKQNGVLLPTGVSAPCPTCGNTAQSTSYDANNNPTSKTGYDGSTTTYVYDALGRETQRVVGAGTADAKTTTTEWDPQQWLVTRVAAPNQIEAFAYDANGNLLSHTVTPTSDANGSQGFGAVASGDAESTEWTYDANGNVLTAVERKGSTATTTWLFTYDALGNLLTLTNPSGQVGRATQYDASGRLLEAVDVNGVQIKYAYNARGWLTDYDFGDQHIKYEYDAVGFLVKASGPQDYLTRYVYDAAHRLIEVLDNLTVVPTEASVDTSQTPFKAAEAKSLTRVDRVWNSVVEWLKRWLSKLIASAHAQVVPAPMMSYPPPAPISQGAQPSYAWPTAIDVIDPSLNRSKIDPRMAILQWYVRVQTACAAAVNSVVQLASSRQSEYRKAKDFCDDPPDPGSNECATLSKQIDHAKQCIALYSDWDAKWLPGRHDEKIQGWRTRLSNLITDHQKRCTTKP
ncbi:RHS repeat domain-containing protein [Ralstonia insidiosa]|uniref:RHS repeat protein n=1 Tax=Ralstonia insidiosa TaxID=190721 RepID=A0A848NYD0_9RALS|nr:RHS repeat domain-containing protein [Ralstonia insidiosa]NMV37953.1 RHS repeat protein [Ralstonia insidiosa]